MTTIDLPHTSSLFLFQVSFQFNFFGNGVLSFWRISLPNCQTKIPGNTSHAPFGIIQSKMSRSRELCPTSLYLTRQHRQFRGRKGKLPAVIFLKPIQKGLCKTHETDGISDEKSLIFVTRTLPQPEVANLHEQFNHVHE
jgi:hypothetical protein